MPFSVSVSCLGYISKASSPTEARYISTQCILSLYSFRLPQLHDDVDCGFLNQPWLIGLAELMNELTQLGLLLVQLVAAQRQTEHLLGVDERLDGVEDVGVDGALGL